MYRSQPWNLECFEGTDRDRIGISPPPHIDTIAATFMNGCSLEVEEGGSDDDDDGDEGSARRGMRLLLLLRSPPPSRVDPPLLR